VTAGGGKVELEEAIKLFEQAVELDPEFIAAHSRLAGAHLLMYWYRQGRWDKTDERLVKAKNAIDKASIIDPEHHEVQLAQGYYYYWGYRNYDDALKYLLPALEKQPNNSDVSAAIGYVYRRNGEWNDAIAFMKRAVDLDPRSDDKASNLAQTYIVNRMWKEAERYTDRVLLLKPEVSTGYWWKMWFLYLSKGDLEEIRLVLNAALKNIDPNKLIFLQGWFYDLERNFSKALNVYESDTRKRYGDKALLHSKLGHTEIAYSYFDSLRIEAEDDLSKGPENYGALYRLGLAYAGLGRKVEAIEKGLEAVELLPLSKDALSGTERLEDLARIYTMVGEYDKAIDQLELLLSIPSWMTEQSLKLDSQWDPLREHPRFIKLIEG